MALKAVQPFSAGKRGGAEFPKDLATHQGRAVPCPKGQGAKGSMIDGPFGGSKPA